MNQSQITKKSRDLKKKQIKNSSARRVPGKVGGTLIRKVIKLLSEFKVNRPIDSHILIACSGGVDSVALSHLLVFYGRRIIDPKKITLLHINHGWRGVESDRDEKNVRDSAKKWGVSFLVRRLDPQKIQKGESWENHARQKRNEIFQSLLQGKSKYGAVFTAHHANDVAETMLWRFCTGNYELNPGGIYFQNEKILRPFLTIKKEEILQYAHEENLKWFEDETNQDTDFLRNALRINIMNALEKLFPKLVNHMVDIALQNQQKKYFDDPLQKQFQELGLYLRKNQWEEVHKQMKSKRKSVQLKLPGQWVLQKEKQSVKALTERWILERKKSPK